MGFLDFLSKSPPQWQVFVCQADGSEHGALPPDDRRGAMGTIISVWDAGAKIEQVMYAGKPISKTQCADLVADAHILNCILETANKQGVPFETVVARGLDTEQMKTATAETARRVSLMLKITEDDAFEVLLRRGARGIVAIGKQTTP